MAAAEETFELGPWTVEVDSEATRQAYAAAGGVGAADTCPCAWCRNFSVARERVFPAEFLALLDRLGVDSHCEDEVSHYGPAGDESWWGDYKQSQGAWQTWNSLYLGSFHAIGRVSPPPPPQRQFPIFDAYAALKWKRAETRAAWAARLRVPWLARGPQPWRLEQDEGPPDIELGPAFSYSFSGQPLWSNPFGNEQVFAVCFRAAVPYVLTTAPWAPTS
jgi:hypothetical protein